MSIRSSDFRSPAQLIDQIATAVPLVEDTAYLVLVARPSTEQRIVTIRRLETPALIDDYDEPHDEIYAVMQTLPIPERPAPLEHSVITVVVRPGLCVFGPNEGCWMNAWRYSNHFRNAFDGRLILVTEHGWCDFMTDTAGVSPSMAA